MVCEKKVVSSEQSLTFVENSVFIVADFGEDESKDLVNKKLSVIIEACAKLGLNAKSAKNLKGGGDIISKIRREIEEAEFVICDISEPRGFANANVYYEFGYAHGCENGEYDLFTICDTDTFTRLYENKKIPFDIQSHHIHKFSDDESLEVVIQENLKEMMKYRH